MIDRDIHGFNHYEFYEKYNNIFDDFLIEESESYLEELPKGEMKLLLQQAGLDASPLCVCSWVDAEAYEGIEDPELLHCKKMDAETVFVSYRFYLRGLDLRFHVPIDDFYTEKEAIECYENISFDNEEVAFSAFLRAYLDVTFTHNIQEETQANFSVSKIRFVGLSWPQWTFWAI